MASQGEQSRGAGPPHGRGALEASFTPVQNCSDCSLCTHLRLLADGPAQAGRVLPKHLHPVKAAGAACPAEPSCVGQVGGEGTTSHLSPVRWALLGRGLDTDPGSLEHWKKVTLAVKGHDAGAIIASPNALPCDEDVWHGGASGFLCGAEWIRSIS